MKVISSISTPYTLHPYSTILGFGANQQMTLTLMIERTKENIKNLIMYWYLTITSACKGRKK